MTKATANLIWHFEAINARGDQKRFQCSKPINVADWDDAREAAIFFTMNETIPALDGWHLTKPSDIRVWDVRPLADVGLA